MSTAGNAAGACGGERARKWVASALRKRRGDCERRTTIDASQRHRAVPRDRGLGQRAGLVEHDVRGRGEILERIGTHDEHAAAGEHRERARHGRRRRQRERAGARHDEHRNGRRERA